jgi:mRNA interferase HigB
MSVGGSKSSGKGAAWNWFSYGKLRSAAPFPEDAIPFISLVHSTTGAFQLRGRSELRASATSQRVADALSSDKTRPQLEIHLSTATRLTDERRNDRLVTKTVTKMRIISRKVLREFIIKHPQAEQGLDTWYRRVSRVTWITPADVKRDYGTSDILPDNRVVFNISGNNFRLIVRINYHRQSVYIRFIGTHTEYDRINATTI